MEQTASGHPGKDGVRTRYFRCRTALRDKTLCPGQPYLPAAELEKAVLERLRVHLGPFLYPEAPSLYPPDEEAQAHDKEIQRLHAELDRRRTALETLYLDRCGGVVEEEEFRALHQRFRQQAAGLEQRLRALEAAPTSNTARTALEQRLQQAASLSALDRTLVDLTVERIAVFPPENGTRTVEIHWKF